ncbi:MFS transporter [Pseudomonas asuensis]|uniref:MFS transporter n=1 Tax=Pseudomonas asuensis TaxID=1825787 RepID=A0ABQ2GLU1_9PSED|nr:MFS transporter [Pseudomonas asuensis]GGM01678.1 hypothetical protein GCM10009425_11150 [Pseudomonas asuensis]
MNLRTSLIAMTALAVISDTMLIPFYPQYFASRFGETRPEHVGAYLAAICFTVMLALPVWARVARRVHPVRLLIWTQLAAGLLCLYCYWASTLLEFWLVSLGMIVFKGSYLLMYPYVMSMEDAKNHTQTIGTLSVVVHFGAILGAVVGGLVLQVLEPRDVFVVMALGDFLQMTICGRLLRQLPPQAKPARALEQRTGCVWPIYRLCLLMLLFYFSGYLVKPFFTVYWEQAAKVDHTALTGMVYAIPGGMALLGLWLNRRTGSRQQALPGAMLLGVVGLLLQSGGYPVLIVMGQCLYGWSMFQVTVRLDALLFELSTPEAYAADYSKINFFQQLGVVGSSFAAGSLVSTFGLAIPFVVGAAGFALTALAYPLLVHTTQPTTLPAIDKGV